MLLPVILTHFSAPVYRLKCKKPRAISTTLIKLFSWISWMTSPQSSQPLLPLSQLLSIFHPLLVNCPLRPLVLACSRPYSSPLPSLTLTHLSPKVHLFLSILTNLPFHINHPFLRLLANPSELVDPV